MFEQEQIVEEIKIIAENLRNNAGLWINVKQFLDEVQSAKSAAEVWIANVRRYIEFVQKNPNSDQETLVSYLNACELHLNLTGDVEEYLERLYSAFNADVDRLLAKVVVELQQYGLDKENANEYTEEERIALRTRKFPLSAPDLLWLSVQLKNLKQQVNENLNESKMNIDRYTKTMNIDEYMKKLKILVKNLMK